MRKVRLNDGCELVYPKSAHDISVYFIDNGFDAISGMELIELINSASSLQLSPIDVAFVKNQWREIFDVSEQDKVSASEVGEWLFSRSNYEIYS